MGKAKPMTFVPGDPGDHGVKKVEAGWTLAQPASFCGISRILSRRSLLEETAPDDHLSHPYYIRVSRVRGMRLLPESPRLSRAGRRLTLCSVLHCKGFFMRCSLRKQPVGSYPAFSPLSRLRETVYFL